MKGKLPPAVQIYVNDKIKAGPWAELSAQVDPLCNGCPGFQSQEEPPPCYSCPLWALRLDLAQLRLLRALELGSQSDKA